MRRLFTQLRFQGPDAAAFLQGYLTADMDALRPDVALPVACCNLQGRVVASGWASGEPSDVYLLLAESAAAPFAEHLRKYLLFSKSQLTTPTAGLRFSPAPSSGAVALPPTAWHATLDAEADDAHDEFADACVASGFVTVSTPVLAAFLPQMLGLTDAGAVSFTKGCYLGQEVVARAQHRGQVKQTLRAYRYSGESRLAESPPGESPPIGAEIVHGERKIGVVVAVGSGRALAVTRSDASPVTAAGHDLTLAD